MQALMNTPSDYESKGGCISCLHQSGIQDYKDDLDPLGNKDYKKLWAWDLALHILLIQFHPVYLWRV